MHILEENMIMGYEYIPCIREFGFTKQGIELTTSCTGGQISIQRDNQGSANFIFIYSNKTTVSFIEDFVLKDLFLVFTYYVSCCNA